MQWEQQRLLLLNALERGDLLNYDRGSDAVFCFKYLRIVASDNTATLGPRQVQILARPEGRSYAKARVEIRECLDGTVAVIHQGQRLVLGPLTPAPSTRIPARDHRRVRPKGPQPIQDLRVRKRKEGGQGRHGQTEPRPPVAACAGRKDEAKYKPGEDKFNKTANRTRSLIIDRRSNPNKSPRATLEPLSGTIDC